MRAGTVQVLQHQGAGIPRFVEEVVLDVEEPKLVLGARFAVESERAAGTDARLGGWLQEVGRFSPLRFRVQGERQ